MRRKVVYPGSFDPITNGHLDVIERAARLFDHVVVAVARNPAKHSTLDIDTRQSLVRRATEHLEGLMVDTFEGLLVDYAQRIGGQVVIRGLRAVSDFEFEFQMALMNRQLDPRIETIFLMPRDQYVFLSSSIVKEIASFGGRIDGMVPDTVKEDIRIHLHRTLPLGK